MQSKATFYAAVDYKVAPPIDEEVLVELVDDLAQYGAAASMKEDGTGGGMHLAVEADSALAAVEQAVSVVRKALAGREVEITTVEARTEEEMDAELRRPVFPELVSYVEIAEIAKVSRQRARQFAEIADFPKPVLETRLGPLRLRAAVERWVAERPRQSGRPRKVTVPA